MSLDDKNILGSELFKIKWHDKLGVNCFQDFSRDALSCYNELDTSAYHRFIFTNDYSKDYPYMRLMHEDVVSIVNFSEKKWLYTRIDFFRELDYEHRSDQGVGYAFSNYVIDHGGYKWGEEWSYSVEETPPDLKARNITLIKIQMHKKDKKSVHDVYKDLFNARALFEGDMDKSEKMPGYLGRMLKGKGKILVMVPYDQAEKFMDIVKKMPDNALAGSRGYVWFLSRERDDWGNRDLPYNWKKYDVLPNDGYDSELARISGGKLKAKYGRFLTKERYSEEYVAPSPYNNNYNDKAD
ncbi:MAG: hypothetical protein LBU87_01235 [Lactobacillales bacterium]|nr:hypothetical protein [Lactobacillales bacterium]